MSRGWLVLIGALLVAGRAAGREASSGTVVFVSPDAPVVGGPLRIVATSDRPVQGMLAVTANGRRLGATPERHGGPPYWWYLELTAKGAGVHRACLDAGEPTCTDVAVGGPSSRPAGVWPVTRTWNQATEALYSAWVEKLFDDPLDAEPSWRALDEVTRQPARNFLHDHLGLGEDDDHGLRLGPDCADLPYFLRAYFAWKVGLPFAWSDCSRGEGGQPPRCTRWHSSAEVMQGGGDARARMQQFLSRDVAWGVQSGAGRAPAEDDRTDFYPTRLSADTLRPGTVYADPYGHTLVLVRHVAQTASSPGLLLAVDAQPDGTVARKRYWRGNFLFAVDPSLGSAGFKHFRPIVDDGGALRPLSNREILKNPDWGDYSLEQYQSDAEGFYDRVDDVLSPVPLDPVVAFRAVIAALDEQIRTRIRSVANGEAFAATHAGAIPMPEGAAIFETAGAWEDYATPSRDLRLLIAIDVVRGFPQKAARRPERFATPTAGSRADVGATLNAMLRDEAAARRFEYTRSDGSPWTLTLGDVLARTAAFEVGYDPNDCVEVRWGAPPGSAEVATCRRRAPAEQAARLDRYRAWFHDRSRPPR
jgi:hypothetical protein